LSVPLVDVQGVSLRLGRHEVLRRVDLTLHRREIVSLIGPNGAGKTSLIRVILGILRPQAGRVVKASDLVIGYVPQRLHLDPILPLSVARFLTIGRRRDQAATVRALAEVGVPGLLQAQMHDLSGGEFQRVLLARTLLREPDLLILDEPAQGIDFTGQLDLYRLIERLRDQHGCGILLVSHDLHIVMAATNRVLCLNRHICCSGQPESVAQHPEYTALFGPRAAAGLAVYTHSHDHRHALSGEVAGPLEAAPEGAAHQPDAHQRAR
jgi:zinc transport system ATP-binding protein